MRHEVLTAAIMKVVFWDVTPCSLVATNVSEESAASISSDGKQVPLL
jgi:hypothetical protein